jgi:hypothetical protein
MVGWFAQVANDKPFPNDYDPQQIMMLRKDCEGEELTGVGRHTVNRRKGSGKAKGDEASQQAKMKKFVENDGKVNSRVHVVNSHVYMGNAQGNTPVCILYSPRSHTQQ